MAKNTLSIPVKRQYFEQIKRGEKPFEFRLITPYWIKRLVGREYDFVEITLGYPRKNDYSRRLVYPYRGYETQEITHPHFGDSEVRVFAIHVGKAAP